MEIRPILSALLRNKTGPVLVAVQVALSLAILSNALHIVHERQAVAARSSGVAGERDVFTIGVSHLKPGGHQEQLATQRREATLLRAVPGVVSVADTYRRRCRAPAPRWASASTAARPRCRPCRRCTTRPTR